jgi:hypothetical protein
MKLGRAESLLVATTNYGQIYNGKANLSSLFLQIRQTAKKGVPRGIFPPRELQKKECADATRPHLPPLRNPLHNDLATTWSILLTQPERLGFLGRNRGVRYAGQQPSGISQVDPA